MASGKRTRLPESTAQQVAAELHLHQQRTVFDGEEPRPAPRRVPVPVHVPEVQEPGPGDVHEAESVHGEANAAPGARVGPDQERSGSEEPRPPWKSRAVTPPISSAVSGWTSQATSWTPQADSGVVSGRDVRKKD
jgi:hypothetical protein